MSFNDGVFDPTLRPYIPKGLGKKYVKKPKVKKACASCGSIYQANGNSTKCENCRYLSAQEKKRIEKVMNLFCQGCKKSVVGIPKVTTESAWGNVIYYCRNCYKQAVFQD